MSPSRKLELRRKLDHQLNRAVEQLEQYCADHSIRLTLPVKHELVGEQLTVLIPIDGDKVVLAVHTAGLKQRLNTPNVKFTFIPNV